MTNSRHYRTPKFQKQKTRRKIIRFILWMSFGLAIFVALIYFAHHENFRIREIRILNSNLINGEDLNLKVNNILTERYFFLFPKNNSLIFPKSQIKDEIVNSNLAISSADLILANRNTLEITLIEHEPVARWCPNFPNLPEDLQNNSDCYLVNNRGLVYIKSNYFTNYDDTEILTVYGSLEISSEQKDHEEDSINDEIIGQYYLGESVFGNLLYILYNTEPLNINIEYVNSEDPETFYIQTVRGPKLLISKFNKPDVIVSNLKTVIEIEEINIVQFRNLEYIDLRFDNRVYYKIR